MDSGYKYDTDDNGEGVNALSDLVFEVNEAIFRETGMTLLDTDRKAIFDHLFRLPGTLAEAARELLAATSSVSA